MEDTPNSTTTLQYYSECIDPKNQYSKSPQSDEMTCTFAQGLYAITATSFYSLSAPSLMLQITLLTQ